MMSLIHDPAAENEGFHRLLCAFYNRPYTIDSAYGLKVLVRLADYYCSLRMCKSISKISFTCLARSSRL
jgi:hypothetical protein